MIVKEPWVKTKQRVGVLHSISFLSLRKFLSPKHVMFADQEFFSWIHRKYSIFPKRSFRFPSLFFLHRTHEINDVHINHTTNVLEQRTYFFHHHSLHIYLAPQLNSRHSITKNVQTHAAKCHSFPSQTLQQLDFYQLRQRQSSRLGEERENDSDRVRTQMFRENTEKASEHLTSQMIQENKERPRKLDNFRTREFADYRAGEFTDFRASEFYNKSLTIQRFFKHVSHEQQPTHSGTTLHHHIIKRVAFPLRNQQQARFVPITPHFFRSFYHEQSLRLTGKENLIPVLKHHPIESQKTAYIISAIQQNSANQEANAPIFSQPNERPYQPLPSKNTFLSPLKPVVPALFYYHPQKAALNDLKKSITHKEQHLVKETTHIAQSNSARPPDAQNLSPTHLVTTQNELNQLTEQVYHLLERKLKVERERRGRYA